MSLLSSPVNAQRRRGAARFSRNLLRAAAALTLSATAGAGLVPTLAPDAAGVDITLSGSAATTWDALVAANGNLAGENVRFLLEPGANVTIAGDSPTLASVVFVDSGAHGVSEGTILGLAGTGTVSPDAVTRKVTLSGAINTTGNIELSNFTGTAVLAGAINIATSTDIATSPRILLRGKWDLTGSDGTTATGPYAYAGGKAYVQLKDITDSEGRILISSGEIVVSQFGSLKRTTETDEIISQIWMNGGNLRYATPETPTDYANPTEDGFAFDLTGTWHNNADGYGTITLAVGEQDWAGALSDTQPPFATSRLIIPAGVVLNGKLWQDEGERLVVVAGDGILRTSAQRFAVAGNATVYLDTYSDMQSDDEAGNAPELIKPFSLYIFENGTVIIGETTGFGNYMLGGLGKGLRLDDNAMLDLSGHTGGKPHTLLVNYIDGSGGTITSGTLAAEILITDGSSISDTSPSAGDYAGKITGAISLNYSSSSSYIHALSGPDNDYTGKTTVGGAGFRIGNRTSVGGIANSSISIAGQPLYLFQTNGTGAVLDGSATLIKGNATAALNVLNASGEIDTEKYPNVRLNTATLTGDTTGFIVNSVGVEGGRLEIAQALKTGVAAGADAIVNIGGVAVTTYTYNINTTGAAVDAAAAAARWQTSSSNLAEITAPTTGSAPAVLSLSGGAYLGVKRAGAETVSDLAGALLIQTGATLEYSLADASLTRQRLRGNLSFFGAIALNPGGSLPVEVAFAPATGVAQTIAGGVFTGAPTLWHISLEVAGGSVTFAGSENLDLGSKPLDIRYSGAANYSGAQVVLKKTGGARLITPLILITGNATTATTPVTASPATQTATAYAPTTGTGAAVIFGDSNQVLPSTIVRWQTRADDDGNATTAPTAFLALAGTVQTLAGLESGTYAARGNGGVENIHSGASANTTGALNLTIGTTTDSEGRVVPLVETFHGTLRDGAGTTAAPLKLTKNGAGTQQIGGTVILRAGTGANTGAIAVNAGILEFFSLDAASVLAAPVTVGDGTAFSATGATLRVSGAVAAPIASDIALNNGLLDIAAAPSENSVPLALTGDITGAGNVTITSTAAWVELGDKTAPGTSLVKLDNRSDVFAINAGRVVNYADWSQNAASLVLADGAGFDLRGANMSVSSLSGAGEIYTSVQTAAGVTLQLGLNGQSGDAAQTFAGVIAAGGGADPANTNATVAENEGRAAWGALTLEKIGDARQILSGLNAAPKTLVTSGILQIGDATGAGESIGASIRVAAGAHLEINVADADATRVFLPALSGPTTGAVAGNFDKTGDGTVLLRGNAGAGLVSYNITGGTLQLGASRLPAGATLMAMGDETAAGARSAGTNPADTSLQLDSANAGYRGFLFDLLTGAGAVTSGIEGVFTGDFNTHDRADAPLSSTLNAGHAGLPNEMIASLLGEAVVAGVPATVSANRLEEQLTNNTPNALLLHIGLNDLANIDPASEVEALKSVAAVEQAYIRLLEKIATLSPSTKVFAATLIPAGEGGTTAASATLRARVAEFNTWLRAYVAALQSAGANIVLVEMEDMPVEGLLNDGSRLRPDNTGYSWMASRWYAALLENFGGTTAGGIAPTSIVNVGVNGVLDVNNLTATAAALTGSGRITLGAATVAREGELVLSPAAGETHAFTGAITGNGGITMNGATGSVQRITGNASYTGATTVKRGILQFANTTASNFAARRLELTGGLLRVGDAGDGTFTLDSAQTSRAGRLLASVPVPTETAADIEGNLDLRAGHTLAIGPAAGDAANAPAELIVSKNITLTASASLAFDLFSDDGAGTGVSDILRANTLVPDTTAKITPTVAANYSPTPNTKYTLISLAAEPANPANITLDDSQLGDDVYLVGRISRVSIAASPTGTYDYELEIFRLTDGYTWAGTTSSLWFAGAGNANWLVNGTTTPLVTFPSQPAGGIDDPAYQYFSAVFPDDPVVAKQVSITTTVEPTLIEINGGAYTFTNSAAGSIGGIARIAIALPNANDTVTFHAASTAAGDTYTSAPNTFTGRVVVSRGILILTGDASAFLHGDGEPSLLGAGSGSSALELSGGAVLEFAGTGVTTTSRGFAIGEGGATLLASTSTPKFTGGVVQIRGESTTAAPHTLTLNAAAGIYAELGARLGDNSGAATGANTLALVKEGDGAWRLSGDNYFSGGLLLNAGSVSLLHDNAAGTGAITFAGGELDNFTDPAGTAGVSVALPNPVVLPASGVTTLKIAPATTLRLDGEITGAATLTAAGGGVLALGHDNRAAFTGGVVAETGTVLVFADGALGTGALTLGGAATLGIGVPQLRLTAVNPGSAGTTGTITVAAGYDGAAGVVFVVNTGATTFAGNFANGSTGQVLNLGKEGAGTLVLTGSNSATGSVTVSAGSLILGGPEALNRLGHASIEVKSGATLDIAGNDLSRSAADIAGTGAANQGALLDSAAAGGQLPVANVATAATIRITGASLLAGAAGAGALTLERSAAAIAADASVTYTLGAATGASSVATLNVAAGVTVKTTVTDAIAPETRLTLADATAVLEIAANTSQRLNSLVSPDLAIGGAGSIAGAGTLVLEVPAAATREFTGSVDGAASLTVTGPGGAAGGTLKLNSARDSTTTGVITVSNATLRLMRSLTPDADANAAADPLGALPDPAATGTAATGSMLLLRDAVLESDTIGASVTARVPVLAGSASEIRVSGAGNLIFESTANIVFADGTIGHTFTLSGDGDARGSVFGPALSDPLDGGSTTLVKHGSATWTLAGASVHTGGTFIESGALVLGTDNALPAAGSLVLGSADGDGELRLAGHAQTLASLAVSDDIAAGAQHLAANRVINGVAEIGVLTLDLAGDPFSAAGAAAQPQVAFTGSLGAKPSTDETYAVENAFSFVKTGDATLTLTGGVYNTADLTVARGLLVLAGAESHPAAKLITVAIGAALDVSALPAVADDPATTGVNEARPAGTLVIAGSKTLRAGSNPDRGDGSFATLFALPADITGNVTLAGAAATLEFNQPQLSENTTGGALLRLAGTLSVTADNARLLYYLTEDEDSTTSAIEGTNSLLVVDTLELKAKTYIAPELASGALSPGYYPLIHYGTFAAGGDWKNLRTDTATSLDPRYAVSPVGVEIRDGRQVAVPLDRLPSNADGEYLIGEDGLPDYSAPNGKSRTVWLQVDVTAVNYALRWIGDVEHENDDGTTVVRWNGADRNFEKDYTERMGYFPEDAAVFGNDPGDNAAAYNIVLDRGALIGQIQFNNNLAHEYHISGGPLHGEGHITGEGVIKEVWLEKTGEGTVVLESANSYRGRLFDDDNDPLTPDVRKAATILVQGTLAAGNDASFGPDPVLIYGGTLAAWFAADDTAKHRALANEIVLSGSAQGALDSAGGTLELLGAITGGDASRLTKTGAGTVILSGDSAGFHGRVDIAAGTLQINSKDFSSAGFNVAGATYDTTTGALLVPGGILEITGQGVSRIGELRGARGGLLTGDGTLETGANDSSTSFAGDVSGSLRLVKSGTGTLTLAGDNSAHYGDYAVTAGRLQFGDGKTGTLGTETVTVAAGAKVAFQLPATETGSPAPLTLALAGAGTFEKLGAEALAVTTAHPDFLGTVSVNEGVLEIADGGSFANAAAFRVDGSLLFSKTEDYVFDKTVSGGGELVANPSVGRRLTWLGDGSVKIVARSGTFAIGDGATVLNQQLLFPAAVDAGAKLLLQPAAGGSVTLGDVSLATSSGVLSAGILEKTGAGTAAITGELPDGGVVVVREGKLEITSGAVAAQTVTGSAFVTVERGATLAFSRSGATRLYGALTGEGDFVFSGGANNAGTTLLLSPDNAIAGPVTIERGGVLQVGENGSPSVLAQPGSPVVVTIAENSTLRLANLVDDGTGDAPTTGALLALVGEGVVEFYSADPDAVVVFNSNADNFRGSLRAASGTLVLDAEALPAGTALDATGLGQLRIESGRDAETLGATVVSPTFGSGDGTVALAPKSGGPAVVFELPDAGRFGGSILVDSRATLHLTGTYDPVTTAVTGNPLRSRDVVVESGAWLTGNGSLEGHLYLRGGSVKPGNSVGKITVGGDVVSNGGAIVIDVEGVVDGAGNRLSASRLNYAGTASLDSATRFQLRMTEATYATFLELAPDQRFKILRDDSVAVAGSGPDLTGVPAAAQIELLVYKFEIGDGDERVATHNLYAYRDTDASLTLADQSRLIANAGATGSNSQLRDTLIAVSTDTSGRYSSEYQSFAANLLSVDNPADYRRLGPDGYGAVTAMSVAMLSDDGDLLRNRLRTNAPAAAGAPLDFQPWFSLTGRFAENSGNGAPAFDYDTYGAAAGIETLGSLAGGSITGVFGVNAALHHGRATLADGAGKIKQDNGRLALYGALNWARFGISGFLTAGHNNWDVRHKTWLTGVPGASGFGTAKASTDGYEVGGGAYLTGDFAFASVGTGELTFQPYAGFEYLWVNVSRDTPGGDAFAETGTDAALRLRPYGQDSLRVKAGVALGYTISAPWARGTAATTPASASVTQRLAARLELAIAHELLDTEVDVNAAVTRWGDYHRWTIKTGPETTLEFGPSLDIPVAPGAGFQLSYHYETDFDGNLAAHKLNASFRVRF
ncbi:MAG: autotransporter-associated beta strand repeat-containing protein [Puniceicoccales bacterium]|jgi:autotransporter-associated beta strand protein|nr:autotransporter-associated beta strand repeat-containing protein [Puniceicoccales bacterium]